MKNSSMLKIKPGDLIEWIYTREKRLVIADETLWSRIENSYVPIGSNLVHICVAVDDEAYSWLNEKGLFHACKHDCIVFHNHVYVSYIPFKCA